MVEETDQNSNLNKNSRKRFYSRFKIPDVPCLRCGTCCRKYQPWLTPAEVDQLAARLNISTADCIAAYTDRRWPGTRSFLLLHRNGGCLFLEASPDGTQFLCQIHAFKPASCRDWAAGLEKPECQAGLKSLFDLAIDPQGRIYGDADKLASFETCVCFYRSD
jgi:uncharacterized protein